MPDETFIENIVPYSDEVMPLLNQIELIECDWISSGEHMDIATSFNQISGIGPGAFDDVIKQNAGGYYYSQGFKDEDFSLLYILKGLQENYNAILNISGNIAMGEVSSYSSVSGFSNVDSINIKYKKFDNYYEIFGKLQVDLPSLTTGIINIEFAETLITEYINLQSQDLSLLSSLSIIPSINSGMLRITVQNLALGTKNNMVIRFSGILEY